MTCFFHADVDASTKANLRRALRCCLRLPSAVDHLESFSIPRAEPHLPLSPEPVTQFHSAIRAVASYHTVAEPSPPRNIMRRQVRSSSSYLPLETIVSLLFPTARPHHVNMHVTIARYITLLNLGFPLRLHASAFRLHAKRRSGRASVCRGLLHESHQLFRRVNIIRFAPHAVTVLPVSYQKHFAVRFVLLFTLSPGPSLPKDDVLAALYPAS
jgi:hypothetical protein